MSCAARDRPRIWCGTSETTPLIWDRTAFVPCDASTEPRPEKSAARYRVQFTARKRDPGTGERNRWVHGPFHDLAEADEWAAERRLLCAGIALVEVIPYARRPTRAVATKAGMTRARSSGKHVGRPKAKLVDVTSAAGLLASGLSIRATAKRLKVPESSLRRALQGAPKGLGSNPSGSKT